VTYGSSDGDFVTQRESAKYIASVKIDTFLTKARCRDGWDGSLERGEEAEVDTDSCLCLSSRRLEKRARESGGDVNGRGGAGLAWRLMRDCKMIRRVLGSRTDGIQKLRGPNIGVGRRGNRYRNRDRSS
jgi:hypothetical protein